MTARSRRLGTLLGVRGSVVVGERMGGGVYGCRRARLERRIPVSAPGRRWSSSILVLQGQGVCLGKGILGVVAVVSALGFVLQAAGRKGRGSYRIPAWSLSELVSLPPEPVHLTVARRAACSARARVVRSSRIEETTRMTLSVLVSYLSAARSTPPMWTTWTNATLDTAVERRRSSPM